MKKKLLAVMPRSTNYVSYYDVEIAHSFQEAAERIQAAELRAEPYATLDLPVSDEEQFWCFVAWMEKTHRKYSFSIFGEKDVGHFCEIAQKVREKGFTFNT